jgi:hypothetical protein
MAYYRWGILAFKPRMGVSWDNSKKAGPRFNVFVETMAMVVNRHET